MYKTIIIKFLCCTCAEHHITRKNTHAVSKKHIIVIIFTLYKTKGQKVLIDVDPIIMVTCVQLKLDFKDILVICVHLSSYQLKLPLTLLAVVNMAMQ